MRTTTLAIEMGANTADTGKMIHPHPKLSESIYTAVKVAQGSCTDLLSEKIKFLTSYK